MVGEWREVTVEQIASKIAMGPFGSDIKTENFIPSGVPVIRGGNLTSGRFHAEDFVFLTEDKADELANANAFPGDIVVTHRGTLGQVGLVPNRPFERYVVSQSQMKLTCNPSLADASFVYYFLRSPAGQHELLMNTSQTGVPAISRPVTSLRNIRLSLPPLPEQRAIARILGTLDDKIELNQRISGTMEALAQTLFKSWFVDFDPVRARVEGRDPSLPKPLANLFPDSFESSEAGEIPKGWAVGSLDMIARFLNGLALQRYPPKDGRSLPVIKIAQLRTGSTEGADAASADLDPDYIVQDGDVLFSWSGSLECVMWAGGNGALNQHIFKVTSAGHPKWLYYLWIHQLLPDFRHIAAAKATTMGHIQRHHLSEAKVIIPPSTVLQSLGEYLGPLIEGIPGRRMESAILARIRDALLPRLISGELRIDRAERFLGETS